MSRRDNGLPATSYIRLRDVETHVVEGLLERLRDEQVAAYVAPAAGRRGPYGDTVLPGVPSDSVYVDTDRREHAQSVIDRYLTEVQDELAWASIIAGFDSPSADTVPRWPASEDLDPAPDRRSPGPQPDLWPDESGAVGGARVVRPAERDALSSAAPGAGAPPPEDDHFEPPPPPPIPLPDVVGRFAWAAVLGGPLFLVVATLLDLEVSGWAGFLALTAFVGGFVTLVARMKDRPPEDLGGDDGAVV
ncbi:MAG: hypothetical protein QOE40_3329 [Actinomycetota bacterium]|jgi:hypothetical protein|nr:hypothetical protein [Actinomycetota bacterium]